MDEPGDRALIAGVPRLRGVAGSQPGLLPLPPDVERGPARPRSLVAHVWRLRHSSAQRLRAVIQRVCDSRLDQPAGSQALFRLGLSRLRDLDDQDLGSRAAAFGPSGHPACWHGSGARTSGSRTPTTVISTSWSGLLACWRPRRGSSAETSCREVFWGSGCCSSTCRSCCCRFSSSTAAGFAPAFIFSSRPAR